jgi:hypothetical protein
MDAETAARLPEIRVIRSLGDAKLIAREYFADRRTINQRCAQIIEEYFEIDPDDVQDLAYVQMTNQAGNTIVTFRGEAIALIEVEKSSAKGTKQCPANGQTG